MTYSFTINTDASHHPQTKVSAWACWIKSYHYKIKDSGLFPEPVENSSVSELMAIEQALILLDKLISHEVFLQTRSGIKLYINTDSMWTIQALSDNVKRSKHREVAGRIRSLTEGFDIEVRHVKAHRKVYNSRTWVNKWCDEAAKSLVRRKVSELNATKTT
jgi:ribonuclease HI